CQRQLPFYSTDFVTNQDHDTPWGTYTAFGGSSNPCTGTANHVCVSQFTGGSFANTGFEYISDPKAFLLAGGENYSLVFNLSGSSTDEVRFGLIDQQGAGDETDGAYMSISGATLTGKT